MSEQTYKRFEKLALDDDDNFDDNDPAESGEDNPEEAEITLDESEQTDFNPDDSLPDGEDFESAQVNYCNTLFILLNSYFQMGVLVRKTLQMKAPVKTQKLLLLLKVF